MNKEDDGLILSSITYAMRAKEILQSYNIQSYLQKLPSYITGCGCGYGLRISMRDDLYAARQLIVSSGILVKGSYCSDDIS